MSELEQLQQWYDAQCDGDWEHEFGVQVETLDNPGWSVTIDLAETELEACAFAEIRREAIPNEWLRCWVADLQWRGVGGPTQLTAIVREFVAWTRACAAQRPGIEHGVPLRVDAIERTVLTFVRSEEVCSRFELEQLAVSLGRDAHEAAAMIAELVSGGWLEVVGGGGEEGAMLLRLTDAGDDAVQRHAAS